MDIIAFVHHPWGACSMCTASVQTHASVCLKMLFLSCEKCAFYTAQNSKRQSERVRRELFYLRDPGCCITAQPDFLAFASRKCELVTSSQLGPKDVVATGTNTVEDPKPLLVQAYIDICFHTYLIMQLIVAWVSTSCLKARLIGCLQPLSWT